MKTKDRFIPQHIKAWPQHWDDRVAIFIVGMEEKEKKYFDGEKYCRLDEGGASEPAFILRYEQAKDLMDSLWDAGIRPEQAKGSAGQLEAVKYHLEDMRKAFEIIVNRSL